MKAKANNYLEACLGDGFIIDNKHSHRIYIYIISNNKANKRLPVWRHALPTIMQYQTHFW